MSTKTTEKTSLEIKRFINAPRDRVLLKNRVDLPVEIVGEGPMIEVRDLERREIVRICEAGQHPHRVIVAVFDLQPDRLDTLPFQGSPEILVALRFSKHHDRDSNVVLFPVHSSTSESWLDVPRWHQIGTTDIAEDRESHNQPETNCIHFEHAATAAA